MGGTERFRLFWDPRFTEYDFGPGHPFQERYRALAVPLLRAWRPDWSAHVVDPGPVPVARREVLERFHTSAYLDRVEAVSGSEHPGLLDRGDTPGFPGCFDASARIVGGALAALAWIRAGTGRAALHPAGGLHHAGRSQASGFCIFNDVALVLASALSGPEARRRVAYVDIDAHQGDGVMYGFYEDGRVLDIDFHQDGRTLFPGSGAVEETGRGDGAGLKANVPMPPGTGDLEFRLLFGRIVPTLLDRFHPELVVLQHGIDGHRGDPLTALRLGPASYRLAVSTLREWTAERSVPFLVTGGGGYRPESVARGLARAALLLADPPEDPGTADRLPEVWRAEFHRQVGRPSPEFWEEPPPPDALGSKRAWIEGVLRDLGEGLGHAF